MPKKSVALLGLWVIALILVGCGNAGSCKTACKKIAQCMGIDLSGDSEPDPSWSCPLSDECTVKEFCMAKCVNNASCPAITGEDATQMQDLLACQDQCNAAPELDGGLQDSIQWQDHLSLKDGAPLSPQDGKPLSPQDGKPLSPPDKATPLPDTGPSTTGVIVITEMMPDPFAVSDTNGEWFELYNGDSKTIDLDGWTFQDGSGSTKTIIKPGGLLIKPGQYLVLGQNSNTLSNGGVSVDYAYGGFFLNNDGDQLLLYDGGGALVDSIAYSTDWGITAGVSLSLINPSLDNDIGENWCQENTSWSGSTGDTGSPGAPARCN